MRGSILLELHIVIFGILAETVTKEAAKARGKKGYRVFRLAGKLHNRYKGCMP